MSALQRLLSDPRLCPTEGNGSDPTAVLSAQAGNLLRIVSSADKQVPPPNTQSLLKDWSALIELVQAAGRRSREIEALHLEQEAQFERALQRAREGIAASDERARSAEAEAERARLRVEALVTIAETQAGAAEDRARAAEERARHAEGWLTRVQDTILSEFADLTVLPDQAAA